MEWVLLSVLSAVSFSAYSILQKQVLQHHISNVFVFAASGGLVQLAISAALLAFVGTHLPWTSTAAMLMVAAGVIHAGLTLLMYWVVHRSDEISRVVPVADTYPVFVALMAVLFLGEVLTPIKWLAMGLVMAGALLASWHQSLPGGRVRVDRSLFLLIIVSFLIALYSVISKYALEELSIWQAYAVSHIASAPVYLLITRRIGATQMIGRVFREFSALRGLGLTHLALFTAFTAGFLAFEWGPVSLSSAIMATRPLIVLLWVTMMSIFLPRVFQEPLTWRSLRVKAASASLVTVGVAAMALQ